MTHAITMPARFFVIVALIFGALGKFLRLPRADRLALARPLVRGSVVTVAVFVGIPTVILAVFGSGAFYHSSSDIQTLRAFGLAWLIALFVASALYLRRSLRHHRALENTVTGDGKS